MYYNVLVCSDSKTNNNRHTCTAMVLRLFGSADRILECIYVLLVISKLQMVSR